MGDEAHRQMGFQIGEDLEEEYKAEQLHRDSKQMVEDYKLGILEWVGKNKVKVLIQDMDDIYLINVINYLDNTKKGIIVEAWEFIFSCEKKKRKLK